MKRMADMSWAELKEYLEGDDRVILPLGATEEHGPHLGLGTDFIEAEAIAEAVSAASGVAMAPTLNYGMSHALMGFPGTMSLRPATLIAVIEDLFRALYLHGFRRILVVNGHGGNTSALSSALQTVAADLQGLRVKNFEWWTDAEAYRVVIDMMGPQEGSHASAGETAFMLAVRPNAVKMRRLTGRDAPVQPSRELTTIQTFSQKYPDGIMGLDPRNATREAGEALLKKSVEICVHELAEW
jgi:creatinine amidohydrolase